MNFILQVAELIKEDLWINPLAYFNNVTSFFLQMIHFLLDLFA